MKMNIFRRVLLLMILMSFIAAILVQIVNIYQERNLVEDYLIKENTLAAKLAARAIESGSLTRLWPFELMKHITESDDVLFWWLVKPDGKIKLADDTSMQNKKITDSSLGTSTTVVKDDIFYKTGEPIKIIIEPVNTGKYEPLSFLYLGVSLERMAIMQRKVIGISIVLLLPIIIFAMLLSFSLSKSFTRPLNLLMKGLGFISRGSLTHKIEVDTGDEFEELAETFNNMTRKLKEIRDRDQLQNQMKSDFISIAAHQLRTPLTGIKWTLKTLIDGDAGGLNSEQKTVLEKSYASNERVIKLVSNLLDVSRIEDNRLGYDFNRDSFEDILENCLNAIRDDVKMKHFTLTVNKPKKIPKIMMDKHRIEVALINVLDNAVKYTHENGKISVGIKSVGIKNDKRILKIIVEDNGVGIPEKEKNRVFTKFFRGSNVVRMQTEGNGFGLFMARNIIKKHKGKIILRSQENQGTKVEICLPI